MTNSPIRKASLADQVEQILNERIHEGIYPPGGKMTTEEQLAEEFDVSRATIRAAFNAMTALLDRSVDERVKIRPIYKTHKFDHPGLNAAWRSAEFKRAEGLGK